MVLGVVDVTQSSDLSVDGQTILQVSIGVEQDNDLVVAGDVVVVYTKTEATYDVIFVQWRGGGRF